MKKITSLRRLAVALLVSGVSLHAAAQAYADRTIRVGHQAQPDAPISQAARKFAELVAEKSSGRLKIKEFPASQLGNEAQQLGALRGGTQELFIPTTTSLSSVIKEFGLGLAVAILIDATIIRLMVVPALMKLFGHASWYLPKWLDIPILRRVLKD